MSDSGGNVVQIILFIIVAVVYVFGSVLKKAGTWFEEQRRKANADMEERRIPPQDSRGAPSLAVPRPHLQRPVAKPALPEGPAALMRELQDALHEAPGAMTAASPPPLPSPRAQDAPPPAPRKSPAAPQRVITTRSDGQRVSSTGIVIADASMVSSARFGHLAVLRTPRDLRQAILLREILSPPRSRQPLRGAGRAL